MQNRVFTVYLRCFGILRAVT